YVEVRVEKSGGAVMLESGQTLQLVAHERHLLRRTDVEPLIRQGLCWSAAELPWLGLVF
ncbi:hypothetical protein T492DRAFT_896377, partial [Pavlovales sp. CCMP2436]